MTSEKPLCCREVPFGNRPGLTLLELVVVLTILVAVAGLLVPLLPNFVHRANVASCTTNISELDKIIQTYQGTYGQNPDRMDNLVIGGSLASYALTGSTGQYGQASFVAGTLTAAELTSLNSSGINNVANLVENAGGDWRPTAWPYNADASTTATITPLGTNVAVLTQTGANLMGVPFSSNYKYVIFGMNKPCTLFRNMAEEPPYHFADTPAEDPATYYMCFAAVFLVTHEVQDTQGNLTSQTLSAAKYVGTVAFHDFGLATADSHTKEWWDQLKNDRPTN